MRSYLARPLLAAFLALACVSHPALSAVKQRVRGSIESVSATHMVVDDRNGVRVDVQLKAPLEVLVASQGDQSPLTNGRAVGIVTASALDGSLQAVQILLLNDTMAGHRDGGVTWDLRLGQTLIPGRISGRTERNGVLRQLTVSNRDGTKVIFVAPDTPVAMVRVAAAADLKPGATVFLEGPILPDGTVSASRVMLNQGVPEPTGPPPDPDQTE